MAAFLCSAALSVCIAADESARSKLLGYEVYRVPGENMMPTLPLGDLVYVDTTAFKNGVVERGSPVAYYVGTKQANLIHLMRVVAIGGDSLEIKEGQLLLNGSLVKEAYVDPQRARMPFSRNLQRTVVPAGKVYVLGDNRDNSNDSRFVGPIDASGIIGRAYMTKKSWFAVEYREVR